MEFIFLSCQRHVSSFRNKTLSSVLTANIFQTQFYVSTLVEMITRRKKKTVHLMIITTVLNSFLSCVVIVKESRNLPKYHLPIIDVIKAKGSRKNESNK